MFVLLNALYCIHVLRAVSVFLIVLLVVCLLGSLYVSSSALLHLDNDIIVMILGRLNIINRILVA